MKRGWRWQCASLHMRPHGDCKTGHLSTVIVLIRGGAAPRYGFSGKMQVKIHCTTGFSPHSAAAAGCDGVDIVANPLEVTLGLR